MGDLVIEARGLTRYFGRRAAVRDLDLAVPRGCVVALLGRNGSGKTTTIRMLLGLLAPTRGSDTILGEDCRQISPAARGRIGYLPEGHPVYGWMRVREAGRFQSRFHARWNQDVFRAIIGYFRVDPAARVRTLSRGERAGVALALTLAPEPELLILDDPALGLDPVARRALLEAMVYVTRRGERTILFSSHLVNDVERVADRVTVLDAGRVRAACTLETFRSRVRRVVLRFTGPPPASPEIPGLLRTVRAERELSLTIANYNGTTEAALAALHPERIDTVPLDLEESLVSYLDRGERGLLLPETGGAA